MFFEDTDTLADIVLRYQTQYEALTQNVEFVYNYTIIAGKDWRKTVGEFFRNHTGGIPEIFLQSKTTDNSKLSKSLRAAKPGPAATSKDTITILKETHIDPDESEPEFFDEVDDVENPFEKGNGTYDRNFMYFQFFNGSTPTEKFVLEFDDESWGGYDNRNGPNPLYDDSVCSKSASEKAAYTMNNYGVIPQNATVAEVKSIIADHWKIERGPDSDLSIFLGNRLLADYNIFTALVVPANVVHFKVKTSALQISVICSHL